MEDEQAARYEGEGRIKIAAQFVTNANGNWFLPGAGKTEWFKDLEAGPDMVAVPAGKFVMGSPKSEPQREKDEGPEHEVNIPKAFAVGRCTVTRGQFAAFIAATAYRMGGDITCRWTGKEFDDTSQAWRDPGFAQDDSHPVVCVNWDDAQAYVAWLTESSGAAYRLPSEAEWEYACRAGTATPFWWGSSITPDQANYDGSAEPYKGGGSKGVYRRCTIPAMSFDPNPWGLYQVHGNVFEWCEDIWNDSYSARPESLKATGGAMTDGIADWERVLRGGAWDRYPQTLRSARRGAMGDKIYRINHTGFRVVRTLNL
jgi:formylglycine-generating enzyme required for sulfatase activity